MYIFPPHFADIHTIDMQHTYIYTQPLYKSFYKFILIQLVRIQVNSFLVFKGFPADPGDSAKALANSNFYS